MNKFFTVCVILVILFLNLNILAECASAPPSNAIIKAYTPQSYSSIPVAAPAKVNISDCSKYYSIPNEQLFYLSLSAINNANYQILEIQSSGSKILFKVYAKEFLLLVSRQDSKSSFVRITPADSNYNFSDIVVKNIYSFLDRSASNGIKKVI